MADRRGFDVFDGVSSSASGAPNACDGCGASDDELRSCVALTTGIYGRRFTSCTGLGAPPCSGCSSTGSGASVTITSSTGTVLPAIVGDGYYSVALEPGAYSICCNLDNPNFPEAGASFFCTRATLNAGEVVRLDDVLTESPGGDYCDLHAP